MQWTDPHTILVYQDEGQPFGDNRQEVDYALDDVLSATVDADPNAFLLRTQP